MHLRSGRILSRQPASPRASCFCHLNSGTQCGQNARELPTPKLSILQSIADKTKKKTDQGEEPTEVRANSDPSKVATSNPATYKYFQGITHWQKSCSYTKQSWNLSGPVVWQLWGSASFCNIEIVQRFQSKVSRIITGETWFVPNAVTIRDLGVLMSCWPCSISV